MNNSAGGRTIILIPTYNERENIGALLKQILVVAPEAEVMVIDDASPDGTAAVVREMCAQTPQLKLFLRAKKEGLGAAYRMAFEQLRERRDLDTIITMDADGSHNARCLPALLAARQKYDLVIGSRYILGGGTKNWDFKRRCLSFLGNVYARFLVGSGIKDLTSGFVAFSKVVADKIDWNKISARGYAYTIETKALCEKKLAADICEVPIIFEERTTGVSKISWRIIGEGVRITGRLLARRF